MPGVAASTPVIWEDKVFISTSSGASKLFGICLDRKTGKEVWKKQLAEGKAENDRSNMASPSPATDGKHVAFFYGTGDLVVLDVAGTEVWRKNIQEEYGKFAFLWTFSTSPLIHDGKLIMQVLQRDTPVNGKGFKDRPNDSYVVAMDLKSGKEIWKVIRPSDAQSESREAFTTPVIYKHDGEERILIAGGDCISGHDPATGKELWRWGTWNPSRIGHWRLVASPVAGAGVALACGPKGAPVHAVRLGGTGDLEDNMLAWVSQDKRISSDVSTPLFYEGRFYILNSDKRILSCVDPKDGKTIWSEQLDAKSKFEASPTAADGKIYMIDFRGETFVVAAGDKFKLLNKTGMGEKGDSVTRSSIAIAGGNLFIRTDSRLYCIGE
jgi:outer membrane protein assembly factor BamB